MSTRYNPSIVRDNLVLYLDAANTKSYPGSGTTWTDISRKGTDGTLTNGATFNSGNMGHIAFDGTNDYVDITSLPVISNTSAMTMEAWVNVDNLDNDPVRLFRSVYDSLYDFLEPGSIPHVVIILGEYQYKSAFVADQEVNMVACLTQLMLECEFK